MIYVLLGVLTRIVSNSYLNVFQKQLTNIGIKPSVVNCYTYFGLTILCVFLIPFYTLSLSQELVINFLLMGLLGALGNYFIIKALSLGELSSLAPINSYKPIVALIIAFFYLKEIPSVIAVLGIIFIIFGTYILYESGKYNKLSVLYRVLALIFSGTEAVFIKKIILLTNIPTSFALWAISGLIFSFLFIISSKKGMKTLSCYSDDEVSRISITLLPLKILSLLILSVGIMQYSTNFVFSKMNVSYALALFQLSTLLSVFLGVNIFHEKGLKRKLIASLIMIVGAIVIILS